MISFYPGPSKIYPEVASYMQDAAVEGVLSINHRSPEFAEISKAAILNLKEKLNIPEDYTVLYTSSATECWEIIAQSLIKRGSYHIYNGAFGEKWFKYTDKIIPNCQALQFDKEETINIDKIKVSKDTEVICLTQNETSNGTQVLVATIKELKEKFPEQLIAIDATSCMGGIETDFTAADIWLASVQKCFGMPAGLGILICSPKAINRALMFNDNHYYNSLVFMYENIKAWQTPYTPNVLNIYLLSRIFSNVLSVSAIDGKIIERAQTWYSFLEKLNSISPLVDNFSTRSDTVIAVKAEPELISKIKSAAKEKGILLGNGYGQWAKNTFRIANFPAINDDEIDVLRNFLKAF